MSDSKSFAATGLATFKDDLAGGNTTGFGEKFAERRMGLAVDRR